MIKETQVINSDMMIIIDWLIKENIFLLQKTESKKINQINQIDRF